MGKIEKEILGFWNHEFKKSHKLNWWKLKTFAPQNLPLKEEEKLYLYNLQSIHKNTQHH